MKYLCRMVCYCWIGFSGYMAFGVTLNTLPRSDYSDTEISTNCVMEAWSTALRRISFSITFVATPSNNIDVAFGEDVNEDGVLDACEVGVCVGWDCGDWFLRSDAAQVLESTEAKIGEKTLKFSLALTVEGAPYALSASDGDANIFKVASFLEDLYQPVWDTMRLSARGLNHPNEQFEIKFSSDGHIILLR